MDSGQKRKRSLSPAKDDNEDPRATRGRSSSPPPAKRFETLRVQDVDPVRRAERERQLKARQAEAELGKLEQSKAAPSVPTPADNAAEFAKLTANSRSGGVYIPPGRLKQMQAEAAAAGNKESPEYQRMSWDALRKSITGIVNRVNITNIKDVIPELFSENLVRGRGLFARSIMKAQSASLPFTPVFACVVAIINTKLPQVGELVLTRLVSQFRRAFKRNDKTVCHSSTTFIAHLVNQQVADPVIALQILVLLLERPTDDSIEVAVGFCREVGAGLTEQSPKAINAVFERFRAVLNEGTLSYRVQYMIEVLMQVRKDKFRDNPVIPEGLDLVEEDEQIPHTIQLEDQQLLVQEGLNIFKFDPNFLENEEKYKAIKAEILGEGSDDDDGSDSDDEDDSEDEPVEDKEGIEDRTETNLVNLRRIIYLTIMNALNYEEAVHKLLKVQLSEGQEIELVNMVIECCSQERSYSTFYGLIGERLSKLNRVWTESFEEAFRNYYTTIHRYETNRLRNIARMFGHLIATDAISWMVFDVVSMNEDDTTSSSRIFIKFVMTEMVEAMGLKEIQERFKDPEVKVGCRGMFPMDNPKNTRFSVNYFTSIGMGVVTEEMREWLKNAPKMIMEQRRAMLENADSSSDSDTDSDSDSSSSDSYSSSSSSSSDSRHSRRRASPPRRRRYSPSPPARPRRDSRGRDMDISPPPRRRNYSSVSRSRTPPPRRRRTPPPRSPPPRRLPSRSRTPPMRRRDRMSISPPRGGRYDPRRRSMSSSRSPSPPPRRRGSLPPQRDRRYDSRSPSPGSRDSRSPPPRRGARDSRSPPPRRMRDSRSPPPRRGGRDSRSPPPRGMRDSRTPPFRRDARSPPRFRVGGRGDSGSSPSRSPPPRRERSPLSSRAKYANNGGRERDRERERDIRGKR